MSEPGQDRGLLSEPGQDEVSSRSLDRTRSPDGASTGRGLLTEPRQDEVS
ncbi:MAG: hypothetical protein WKG00_15240 [Polyangiaceae bacterium]